VPGDGHYRQMIKESAEMKEKNKLVCSLISFVMILSLALPLLSSVVEASTVTEIRDWYELHAIRDNLGGHYLLMNDLDATTAGYQELASPTANQNKGWEPIGIYEREGSFDPFVGIFDGQGYEIRDLFINRPDEDGMGLFRALVADGEGGVIKNVGVVNTHVTGYMNVGGLLGFNAGNVSSSYSTGNVTGNWSVGGLVGLNTGNVSNSYSYSSTNLTHGWFAGGLVGYNMEGTVSNSHSSGSLTGGTLVGGLVGYNEKGIVSNSSSDASVTSEQGAGGLVGGNDGGTVYNSYSSGSVTGEEYVGGLVGYSWNWDAIVGSCYSSGNVTGNSRVGGLVGGNDYYATVDNSYAGGSVSGNSSVGGLVGYNRGTVFNCYASGKVTGNSSAGGLVGSNIDTVSNSFWDREASGMETSDGGAGKTTTEMIAITTFTDTRTEGLDNPWDITAVAPGETDDAYDWNIVDGESYPFLSGKQPSEFNLTISSTAGGNVTAPGEGVYTYHAGAVIDIVGEPDEGYRFVNWSGNIGTIADVNSATTNITMYGNYTITANFQRPVNTDLITGVVAAIVIAGSVIFFMLRREKES
jgi:hypothetical protein